MKLSIINIDPEILSGEPVFRGTRVPIQVLFDCLQYGTLEEFFDGFPHVSREMVNELFEVLREKKLNQKKEYTYENFA